MCIIQYELLIALYIFILLFSKRVFNHKNSRVREELSYLTFFFRHNCNKSLCKNIYLVSLYSYTSLLVCATPQLTLLNSPNTCLFDDLQRLIFDNSQSPEKFTGEHKIFSHPTSSQESLKHKSTFTFTFRTIYPYTRSMAHPDISAYIENTQIRPYINKWF